LQAHPDWDVHVFERNDTLSFLSCGIALWVGNHVSDPNKMFYSSPEALASLGAHMHMQTDVTSVDVAGKRLTWRPLAGGAEQELPYDKLVITTGSKPVVPPIPGLEAGMAAKRVLLCKNWDHGKYIKDHCASAKRVIVIGAGYIGAELAEQLSEIGVGVTLIDGVDRVLSRTMDAPVTDWVEERYREHDVELALGQMVSGFEHSEDSVTVTTEKGSYTADYAVLAIGFLPRTDLFTGQVEMLKNGAIVVDEYQRVTLAGAGEPSQDVLAAGDSCTVWYNPTQAPDYIPLATNAVRQGLLVGANAVAPTQRYLGTSATSAVQLYDLALAGTGLTADSCRVRGIACDSVSITEDYRPAFMLSTSPVTATLVWDPATRRILGAQFVSVEPDVAQAANVVSVAIQAGMTIDDLAGADLLFQPNFSQPVNYVGSVAMAAVAKAKA
jgi:NADPH-dependent 2,4-dienoyl-CoA reductase/sulfur reductase-like enzyme